ncbi:MAG: PP2C family protein-serine/threonine phosphatase [Hymenobacteraceae bacterium]|nr:PP2C family protein-serine/threonine phosphatase [Hymenobacteraceae bacterium]
MTDAEPNLTRELHLRRQELRALLDITEALNNDALTEEALYRTFGFTLLAQLGYSPVALFVPEVAVSVAEGTLEIDVEASPWHCRMSLPPKHDFRGMTLPLALCAPGPGAGAISVDSVPAPWHIFRTVLPVLHHQRLLAFVLVGEALQGKTVANYADQETHTFVQTLSSIVLVAAQNRGLARERLAREVLQREIEIAREVQQMLFPKHLPDTAAVHVHATYIPHARVGGDYYDCLDLGLDRYLLCVADVSGKGVPASLLMSNFQAGLRTMARRSDSLAEVVTELNHLIHSNAQAEKFITAFIAVYDGRTREVRYVNAGHNPPLIAYPDGTMQPLTDGTLMLGVLEPLPFLTEGRTAALPPGAVLLIYTDGLTDVFSLAGAEYGDEGVIASLRRAQPLPLPELHAALLRDLAEHSPVSATNPNPFPDDITILSCRFK